MKRIILSIILLLFGGTVLADDYIVIMLDTSGSMGNYMPKTSQQKITVAQDSLIKVLSQVPPTTKIGLVTFSGWVYPIGPIKQDALTQAIKSTGPGGGTPLWEYVRDAVTELLKIRAQNRNIGSYKLLIVSDGEANGNRSLAPGQENDVLHDVIRRGVTVDAIGIAMGDQYSVAKLINGKYMSGDDPASLEQALARAVAEVGFKDAGQIADTFGEVAEFSPEFLLSVVKGLTLFENQPIGETAPLIATPDGGMVVDQSGVQTPSQQPTIKSEGMGWGAIILIVLGCIVGVVVIIAVLSKMCEDY